jgi:hypothetical protein
VYANVQSAATRRGIAGLANRYRRFIAGQAEPRDDCESAMGLAFRATLFALCEQVLSFKEFNMLLTRTATHSLLASIAVCFLGATVQAQDQQPSLGEVARQARKDKEKNATRPKKVLTDDDIGSSSTKALSGLSDLGSAQSSGDATPMAKGTAALDRVEDILNKLDPLDRATLAKLVLMDNDVDFPERRSWEDKLYAAKQQYVSHCREIVRDGRQILQDTQALKTEQGGKLDPNNPRTQEIVHKIQELMQDGIRTDNAYQAVVMEGWDLAKQAKH